MIKYPTDCLILTEAGQKTGFGHLVRCTSLQQALKTEGLRSQLIVNGPLSDCQWFANHTIDFHDWLHHLEDIQKQLSEAKVIVIDSYLAPTELYETVARIKKLICIDDNNRLSYPDDSIIINGSIYGKIFPYNQKQVLTGPEYVLLRKEFWNIPIKKNNPSIESMLITFGGGDLRGLTKQVLDFLVAAFPNVQKTVITTAAFTNLHNIIGSRDQKTSILESPSAGNLLTEMLQCDLAISSGGQTLYELARVGVPTIAVAEIDNQLLNVEHWSKKNIVYSVGMWNNPALFSNLSDAIGSLQSHSVRKHRSRLGRKYIDGQGSLKVAKKLKEILNL